MAQFEWPSSLPQTQYFPVTVERENPVVRTEMEAGPDKTRRRTTAIVRKVSISFRFDGDELETFNDFFENDINHGALRFEWNDPETGETADFRFIEPPTFTIQAGGSVDGRLWVAEDVQLEILPTVE